MYSANDLQWRCSGEFQSHLALPQELLKGRFAWTSARTDPVRLNRSRFVARDPTFSGSGDTRSLLARPHG